MNPKIIGLIGTGASVLGVQAATKGLDATWKKVTGRQVPSKNDDPREDRWLDIVLFAVVSGVPSRLRNTKASSEWSAMIASRRRSASAVKDGNAITRLERSVLGCSWR